jgi:PAS domain S-box-containing protein
LPRGGGDVSVTEKANILMVDDQPSKLLSYEAILGDLGENLIKARSGREALEQLLKQDVAVVLLDVSMPEMDGFEMADMMRQHPRFQKTAIIFISAVHLTDLDRIKGYKSGAVDYISVPVIPELLRAKVSVFAELHRKTRELEKLNHELERRVEERTRQLQESESQFRTLANSIPQLAWMANADGTVFWYNHRWYDYTGMSLEEAQGLGWSRIHHPEHRERVIRSVEHSWRTGELWEDTFPMLGKDGEYRWFLSRAVPIRDSHGVVARWFGTSTDISRQIAAEEKIRQLNFQLEQRVAELETIMQVLPVGVAVAHDPACETITANQALSELLGGEPGDNISKSVEGAGGALYDMYQQGRLLAPEDLPMQRAIALGRPVPSAEWEVRRADRKTVQILGSASPLFDGEGRVRGAVAAFFDVSSRKKMEDLLRERAELLELASEAILVRDRSGILQYWNAGAEALYGWNRDQVLGRRVHEVLRTEFPTEAANIEATLTSYGRWDGNLVQQTRDGREITVASRQAFKMQGESILEINRDITAQLKAEEALHRTERLAAMGRVAGIIAHEINNPLEAITNAFYLLRDHPSLDEEAKYFAQLGEEELLRVCHITRQTLGFYRESQDPVDVSIVELLDDLLELQARRLQLNGIQVDKRYISNGTIRGFPVELKQVFLNLIGNSIQAMPDGGRLRIHVAERFDRRGQQSELCISICDTGSGVHPDHAKRLFEPFFSTKAAKGTGLGLWISKGIIQKYEGSIGFRSMPFKGGNITCFRVIVPREEHLLESPVSMNYAGVAESDQTNRGGIGSE